MDVSSPLEVPGTSGKRIGSDESLDQCESPPPTVETPEAVGFVAFDADDVCGQSVASEESEARECWICRDTINTPENPLVANLCRCRGSIGLVHSTCIDYWVFSQRRTNCPSCNATYNIVSSVDERLPKTFTEEMILLINHLLFPLLGKCVNVLLGATINGFCIALLVGFSFYHCDVFRVVSRIPTEIFTVSVAANTNGTTSSTSFNATAVANALQPTDETRDHNDLWLWASVMLFGWSATALWRCLWASWRQWRATFFHEDAVEFLRPVQYTLVECLHSYVDTLVEVTGCSWRMVRRRSVELVFLSVLASIISSALGRVVVVSVLLVAAVGMRLFVKRKKINDTTRRFDEVQERKREATFSDVVVWFITYVVEMSLFSFILPICGGFVTHYSLSPYLLSFAPSFWVFVEELTFLRLLLYWLVGTMSSISLLYVETTVFVTLFAPGVDLYFARSVDLNIESDSAYWSFILAQIFDADPLRVLYDFLRMCFIEGLALYFFLAFPSYAAVSINGAMLEMGRWLWAEYVDPSAIDGVSWVLGRLLGNMTYSYFETLGSGAMELLSSPSSIYWIPLCVAMRLITLPILVIFQFPFQYFTRSVFWTNLLIFVGVGIVIACLQVFPIRRMQLGIMRPIALWIAVHVVDLEEFLFDKERLLLLDEWLLTGGQGDIPVPRVPLPSVFLRRERALPLGQGKPTWLQLRLVVFSILFFTATTVLFWALPSVLAALLLNVMPCGLPLVCCTFNALFCLLNPRLYLKAVGNFFFLCLLVVVGLFLHLTQLVILLMSCTRQQLVRETVEYCFNIKRTVGTYHGEPADDSSEWEDVTGIDEEAVIGFGEHDHRHR